MRIPGHKGFGPNGLAQWYRWLKACDAPAATGAVQGEYLRRPARSTNSVRVSYRRASVTPSLRTNTGHHLNHGVTLMLKNIRWERALTLFRSPAQLTVLLMNLSLIALVIVGSAGKRWG